MSPMPPVAAYAHCLALARRHYENFPVASWLLPKSMRAPVAAVYAFARTADDIADEGDAAPEQRLAALAAYGARLDMALAGRPDDPVFVAVADAVRRHELPPQLFHDLLSAFAQDTTRQRYADFAEVLDYCRRSANPVGRLLLHVAGAATAQNLADSDRICSALQLVNFCQDLAQDWDENRRIYLPQDEMAAFGVTAAHLAERRNDAALRALMRMQVERAQAMLHQGSALGRRLRGRFGLEIRVITQGGMRIAERLLALDDPFSRPRLSRGDGVRILLRSLLA